MQGEGDIEVRGSILETTLAPYRALRPVEYPHDLPVFESFMQESFSVKVTRPMISNFPSTFSISLSLIIFFPSGAPSIKHCIV